MLYVSVDQRRVADSDGELREFLELDLEDVHVAINLVNCKEEVNMMSWDVIYKATQEDGTMLKLLCYRDRFVVRSALRTKVKIGIHAAHQGDSLLAWNQPRHYQDEGWLHDLCMRGAISASWLPHLPSKPGLPIPDDSGGLLLLARPQFPSDCTQIHGLERDCVHPTRQV